MWLGAFSGAMIGFIVAMTLAKRRRIQISILGLVIGAVLGWIVLLMTTDASPDLPPIRSPEQFQQEVLGSDKPVLVDFFARNCPPCKLLAPKLKSLARQYAGRIEFRQVDVQTSPSLVKTWNITGTPTVILYVGGEARKRWVGDQPASRFITELDPILQGTESASHRGENSVANAAYNETHEAERIAHMNEQSGVVTMKGKPLTLAGSRPAVGAAAPEFTALDNNLGIVKLSDFRGKVVLIASVPSLDTGVCDRETRQFNQAAAKLGDTVRILTLSVDLPFAQQRWCGAAGIENLQTLSDHKDVAFGQAYGVLIEELRLLARSVWVIDAEGTIRYVELVKEIASEPNYDAALEAVAELVK